MELAQQRTPMILTETATATMIDTSAPVTFTCASVSIRETNRRQQILLLASARPQAMSSVGIGRRLSPVLKLAKAEAEQTPEPAAAEVEMAIAPATPSTPAPATPAPTATAPTATGENEEFPALLN